MPEKTTQEKITHLSKQEQQREAFDALKGALQLINLEKNRNVTSSTYSRENLRSYLQAPSTETNQKNLRKLSDFLYNISNTYKRMVKYKAEQITCKAWTAYPLISLSEDNDEEKIKQDYENVCRIIYIVGSFHDELPISTGRLVARKVATGRGVYDTW